MGHLTVKVYEAQGLVAADLGGKSDPFVVLELVNARLQVRHFVSFIDMRESRIVMHPILDSDRIPDSKSLLE